MRFRLHPEEPAAGPWRCAPLVATAASLIQLGATLAGAGRIVVVAVDGRSSSGKTSLAARLGGALSGAVVVHTDDLAWQHSRFGWADLLTDGVLRPAWRGEQVTFRPPSWAENGRHGSIDVPAGSQVLIVEGVGAGRGEVAGLVSVTVWVQADRSVTEQRSQARVGQPGGPATRASLLDWMAEEDPFLAAQRPWERADLTVAGTPPVASDALTELVVAPPPGS